ncbi:MAG: hypothetical protein HY786_02350 [Deltaproteobacteria bacterium]|nr:hypothetical protein [Deltaproteobacteria bacterium]
MHGEKRRFFIYLFRDSTVSGDLPKTFSIIAHPAAKVPKTKRAMITAQSGTFLGKQ